MIMVLLPLPAHIAPAPHNFTCRAQGGDSGETEHPQVSRLLIIAMFFILWGGGWWSVPTVLLCGYRLVIIDTVIGVGAGDTAHAEINSLLCL